MAGTLTLNERSGGGASQSVEMLEYTWTSDSSGDVSDEETAHIDGIVANVVFVPESGGDQPDNNYDVTILDEKDIDILSGRGADLSNTTATRIAPAVERHDGTTAGLGEVVVSEPLEITVANAGDTKKGIVRLYIRR